VSGAEERGVITNYEVSSSDSELLGWPSIDTRGSEAVWVYNAGVGTDDVVAIRATVSVTWAWRAPTVGGSVEVTDENTISIVLVPITGGATVSEADIPEVVTTVVWEGVGLSVNSL
jgi:hypothetical protein